MFWKFRKKPTANEVLAIRVDAENWAADRWRYFSNTLAFNNDVTLDEKMSVFMEPATLGIKQRFPILKVTPEDVTNLYILRGICQADPIIKAEIETRFNLPDGLMD